jgi:hypothetical protein
MSEDIVERLRSWRHDSWPADPSLEAADEIERLRARVKVLERMLRGIAEFCEDGHRRPFIAIANTVRAALEAKP